MSLFEFIGQALVGWLLADLVTGIFHWWEDNFGSEEWPIIGAWIIAPNRLHHSDPLSFTRHDFLDRNRASIITAAVVGLIWLLLFGPSVMLATALLGGALANEVHCYAHQPQRGGAWIHTMQKMGLIQSARGHVLHHRVPQNTSYCVLTDWLNPVLDALDVWGRAERLIGKRA